MVSDDRIITNLLFIDYLDYWDEFTTKSITDEKTRKYYDNIINIIDQQLEATVNWLDTEEAKEYFSQEFSYNEEIFNSLEDEWNDIFSKEYEDINELLDEIYDKDAEKDYSDIKEHIKFTETDKLALSFLKWYNLGLINKLSSNVRNQIKNQLLQGLIEGENPRAIAPKILNIAGERLKGSTFSPRQRAVMIARTETSRAQNTGILQTYIKEGFTEVKILTAEDGDVCYTCLKYAYDFNQDTPVIYENKGEEKIHNIIELLKGGSYPPFHPNCRCTYICITSSKGEPPENPFVICLGPTLRAWSKSNGKYNGYGQEVYFTKEDLEKSLKNCIEKKDISQFADLFFYFKKNILNSSFEWCTGKSFEGYFEEVYTYGLFNNIELSNALKKEGLGKGLQFLFHNHPEGSSILPSADDLETFAFYKIKYGVITNEFGTIIVKNNNLDENKIHSDIVKKIGKEIKNSIEKDFLEDDPKNRELYESYSTSDNEKIKLDYITKINNYVNKNNLKYVGLYQEKLSEGDMAVTFINSKGQILI